MESRLHQAPPIRRFQWRLGRRGAFLAMMGTLFVALGYGYGFVPLPKANAEQLAMPLAIIPDMRVWGTIWMICGFVAIFNAWWPPGRDVVGFAALEVFASVWAALNISGALFLGAPRAWVVGLIFAIYAGAVLIVSGMPDPTPLIKSEDEVNGG